LSQSPWKEHKNDSGKVYYYNSETKKSTWTLPKELEELRSIIIVVVYCLLFVLFVLVKAAKAEEE
jgi:hypothetical protein